MVKYVQTDDNIIVIIKGMPYVISNDDPNYNKVVNLVRQNNESEINNLLQDTLYYSDKNWKITNKNITFLGAALNESGKLYKLLQDKIKYNQDYQYIINFFNRFKNPQNIEQEVFDLLIEDIIDQSILIQSDGTFFTYSNDKNSIQIPIVASKSTTIFRYDPACLTNYAKMGWKHTSEYVFFLDFKPE